MKLEQEDYFTSTYVLGNIQFILQVVKYTDLVIYFKYIAKYNTLCKTFIFYKNSEEHVTYLIENYKKLDKDMENRLLKELVFR